MTSFTQEATYVSGARPRAPLHEAELLGGKVGSCTPWTSCETQQEWYCGSWGQLFLPCELGRGCWSTHTICSSFAIPAGIQPAGGESLGAEREGQVPSGYRRGSPAALSHWTFRVSCVPRAVKVGRCVDGGARDMCLISWSCPSGIGQTLGNWPSAFQVGSTGVTHPSPQAEQRTFSWHPAWHRFY